MINLHRQIDAPNVGGVGQVYNFDWYDRPGYGNGHTPTLHFAPAPLVPRFSIPPLGEFGLDYMCRCQCHAASVKRRGKGLSFVGKGRVPSRRFEYAGINQVAPVDVLRAKLGGRVVVVDQVMLARFCQRLRCGEKGSGHPP